MAAGYNVRGVDVTKLFRRAFHLRFVTGFIPNMLLTYRDVRAFWRTHQFMAEAFERMNGLGLSDLLYVLWALCNSALMPDRVLDVLEDPAATEADQQSAVAMSQQQLFNRGYSTRLHDSKAFAKEVAGRAALFHVSLAGTPPVGASLDAAVSWLTVTPKVQSQISLWSSGPYNPLIPHGAAICIDLAAIPFVLHSLFFRVRDAEGEKGTIFEQEFRRGLQAAGLRSSMPAKYTRPTVKSAKLMRAYGSGRACISSNALLRNGRSTSKSARGARSPTGRRRYRRKSLRRSRCATSLSNTRRARTTIFNGRLPSRRSLLVRLSNGFGHETAVCGRARCRGSCRPARSLHAEETRGLSQATRA